MKYVKTVVLGIMMFVMVGVPHPVMAQESQQVFIPAIRSIGQTIEAAKAGPLPPNSNAFEKSLAEWHQLDWLWYFEAGQEQQIGQVVFMPLPNGELEGNVLIGTCKVTLRPATPFVLPVVTILGFPEDDPADYLPEDFIAGATAQVSLNDKVLIDSDTEEIGKYVYGPVFYDPPIMTDGYEFAWAEGIGFVHPPLPVGEHTLHLTSSTSYFLVSYNNTWTITVSPHAETDYSCVNDTEVEDN